LKAEEGNWFNGMRLIDTIRKEMEATIKLDRDYEEASGLRTLARVYYRAPFFKGGDKHRSIELLEDCLRRHPDDSLSMLYLAESYIAVGRREDARKALERMLSLCPDPEYDPELADNQAEARALLTKELRSGK
jgi:cytochrome c-type biogenesis protein CcmH/NrfG